MKILIADDHELYRDALSILVQRLEQDTEIHQACNFTQLLALLQQQSGWDAILIDLIMPDLNYYQGISQLTQDYANIPVIVITSSEDPNDTQQVLNKFNTFHKNLQFTVDTFENKTPHFFDLNIMKI